MRHNGLSALLQRPALSAHIHALQWAPQRFFDDSFFRGISILMAYRIMKRSHDNAIEYANTIRPIASACAIASLVFALSLPVPARADIYRYETDSGEVILTSQPRKDLKLIEVIRSTPTKTQSKSASKADKPKPKTPTSGMPKSSAEDRAKLYAPYIAEASQIYGIPEAFIRAVIKIESNFNPRAISHAGAMGLMQLMPATAEHMRVEDPFDPRQNIMGGVRYLRRLSDRYDGDINLVLSGYHAGPGNVEKAGGIPFEKTQQYVKNVYAWYLRYRDAEKNDNSAKNND